MPGATRHYEILIELFHRRHRDFHILKKGGGRTGAGSLDELSTYPRSMALEGVRVTTPAH